MVSLNLPCRAKVARESISLLDQAVKNHIKECEVCIRELINDFVAASHEDIEGDE